MIAGWTGIPVGKMLADEIKTGLEPQAKLEERVIGQAQAPRLSASASGPLRPT